MTLHLGWPFFLLYSRLAFTPALGGDKKLQANMTQRLLGPALALAWSFGR
jgi:hypothetical protein